MATLIMIVENCLVQFSAIFGVFLVGGGILTFFSRLTNNSLHQFAFPKVGLYLFGLIGIPVHEFSHAFFCKLFLHQVQKVKWFDAKAKAGAHGSVTHLYNPWNLYHRVGHFFIGLGPALLGPIILALLFYFLVPSGRVLFHQHLSVNTASVGHLGWVLQSQLHEFFSALLQRSNWSSIGFYVFLYLSVCISSQIELSREDLKQAATGVVPILILLAMVNILAWSLGLKWHQVLVGAGWRIVSIGSGVFFFAILLTFINLIICTLFFGLVNKLLGRETINPFRSNS